MCKIKQFIRNLKRRNFHSTSTEDGSERLGINDIAEELKVSNSYISRKLKTKLSTSFVDLLSQYRIKKAISYLEKTDLMIYEISCKVGFSDYKYFCTVFKKYTSLSPSEYQKNRAKR